jgi:hypothetical protein
MMDEAFLRYDRLRSRIPLQHVDRLDAPVFVVGSSRSGTSMLTRVLGVAAPFCYFSENTLIRNHARAMVRQPTQAGERLASHEKALIRLSGVRKNQRLLEKTPDHSLIIRLLADYYADAQFMHIMRDGRDSALSMLSHPWIRAELVRGPGVFWVSLLPQKFIAQWSKLSLWQRGILRWALYVSRARAMASHDPGRYIEVCYEELCQAPLAYMTQIMTSLGIATTAILKERIDAIERGSLARWASVGLSAADLAFYSEVIDFFALQDVHQRTSAPLVDSPADSTLHSDADAAGA